MNAAGNALAYSTFVNGATIAALALDSGGNAYITGNATAITTTAGALQTTYPGSPSPYVAKMNATGSAMGYATYLAGTIYDTGVTISSSNNSGKAIAIDSSGNAYVAGVTVSTNFPTYQAFQAARNGTQDVFVSKLNASGGGLVYSTYLGGSFAEGQYTAWEAANGIAVNAAGEAVVVGITNSGDFPVTAGVFQPWKGYSGKPVSNGFVTKFSAAGSTLVYSSYVGGTWCYSGGCTASTNQDAATAVAVDAAGYAYVGGYIASKRFTLVDPIQYVPTLGWDDAQLPYVVKIRPAGNQLVYSVVLGNREYGNTVNGVAVDANGNAYVVGYYDPSYQNSYPLTAGALLGSGSANVNGYRSGYLFKLSTGKFPTTVEASPNPAISNEPITFTANVLSTKPGGTVTFMDGTTSLGAVAMTNGTAQLSTTLPIGIHKITAVYSEDGKVSPALFQTVNSQ